MPQYDPNKQTKQADYYSLAMQNSHTFPFLMLQYKMNFSLAV